MRRSEEEVVCGYTEDDDRTSRKHLGMNARMIMQHRAGDGVTSGAGREMTHFVEVPLTSKRYLCVYGKTFYG